MAAPILENAYTHSGLDSLFMQSGFPGDPPTGNKRDKCMEWMRRANNEVDDPVACFGHLIAEFMDSEPPGMIEGFRNPERDRIIAGLSTEGLKYLRGGRIVGAVLSRPSTSLGERLQNGAHKTVEEEFDRANAHVDTDPPAAVTAASAILEALCKEYLKSVGAALPTSQTLGPLWSATASHLGLSPKDVAGNDLRQILSGLSSIAGGIAALRTHKGSAHGHAGETPVEPARIYRLAPRHARLAVHAAHTMALFVLETWDERIAKAKTGVAIV